MRYIADLHIHSLFSRATSKQSTLAGLAAWAGIKGIQVVGTGDFTHPGWFRQIKQQLTEAEPGFFKLRDPVVDPALPGIVPQAGSCRFVLTAEISSIYKRGGRVRKIHNTLFVPDFRSVEKINTRLAGIGNIESDGRPILGLDSRDLLEILLENAEHGFLVPAHVWTPWFSLFGSKSGFDAIEECFGDLSHHIFALETGLSSDPEMNRLISGLDRFALISNSDCHSPGKLGREANIFDTGFDFHAMRRALEQPNDNGFVATVEFFPEEGKYHVDGHRKCGISMEPTETRRHDNICPVCHKPLTVGVLHRVMELADRDQPLYPQGAPGVHSLIPLPEVLGELLGHGPATKGVMAEYTKVINLFGSEFNLYLNTEPDEIKQRYSPLLAIAVERMQQGRVFKQAGFDGEFGVIKAFAPGELADLVGQYGLFAGKRQRPQTKKKAVAQPSRFVQAGADRKESAAPPAAAANSVQEGAIQSPATKVVVTAGPGTGKTFTLVSRLVRLLQAKRVAPENCTIITFTKRAANEVRERLDRKLGDTAAKVFVGTFHGFCLRWLRTINPDLAVADRDTRAFLLRRLFADAYRETLQSAATEVEAYFVQRNTGDRWSADKEVQRYLDALAERKAVDLDDVIPTLLDALQQPESILADKLRFFVKHLFVDEFQDLNRAQFRLVRTLAKTATVFAIGDPDQAIYGFRGSRPEYLFDFIRRFEAKTMALRQNYRSGAAILAAAGALISHNPDHGRYELMPASSRAGLVRLHHAPTAEAEAEFVVRAIEAEIGGISHFSINSGRATGEGTTRSFGDFAVLYRLTRQAEPLCQALERRGIPFQVVDVPPFFMRPELRPVYWWLKAAANTAAPVEYLSLIGRLKGVGRVAMDKLETVISLGKADFFHQAANADLSAGVTKSIAMLQEQLSRFQQQATSLGISAALHEVEAFESLPGSDDFNRLLDLANAFGADLSAFADHLEANANATVYDARAESISLMTLHAAKGLEFSTVFITGLEEGVLPFVHPNEVDSEAAIEEERRLLYVGMTRARDALFLSHALSRNLFNHGGLRPVSRFIGEIPAAMVSLVEEKAKPRRRKVEQLKLF